MWVFQKAYQDQFLVIIFLLINNRYRKISLSFTAGKLSRNYTRILLTNLPKFPKYIWVDGIVDMLETIRIPSNITKPHIKPSIGQDEGETLVWQICDPVRRRT